MTAPIPPDFWDQVERTAERVLQRYVSSGPLRNASITDGGLTIQNGTLRILYPESQGGGVTVYYGNLFVNGVYAGTGMLVNAPDGTNIASFSWDSTDDSQTAHLHDAQNNTIVSNDKAAGFGLARPWIPGVLAAARFADFRYSTTSAAFETLASGYLPRQHAAIDLGYRVSADAADTAGEVRVTVNGTPIGPTSSEGFAIASRFIGAQVTSGAQMSTLFVEVQARRTAGTGAIRLEPSYFMSRES